MTVRDLFAQAGWQDTFENMQRYYDIEKEEGLRGAFETIVNAGSEVQSSTVVHIEVSSDDEGYGCFDVFGRVPEDEQSYALEFYPISKWASFQLDDDILHNFTPAEAAAHILIEATFFGCSDEEIEGVRQQLEKDIEWARNNPESLIPIEDMIKELGEDEKS